MGIDEYTAVVGMGKGLEEHLKAEEVDDEI